MKNIDRKFIIEVRAHEARKLHNQAWHDFMGQPEAEAVRFAIGELGKGASYAEIAAEARKYMAAIAA